MPSIIFGSKKSESIEGTTLFQYADILNVRVPTSCGRNGKCHECIIEIKSGINSLNKPTETESFLTDNFRLACQAKVNNLNDNIEFSVLRREPKILTKSIKTKFELNPLTKQKENNVQFNDQIIDEYRGAIYGISIDIGTTTIVMNLVNLQNGEIEYISSFENPQKFGGSDIMNRISYDSTQFKGELKKVLISAINFEIGQITRKLKIHRRLIYEMVVVGNSTMRDIFFGIDVSSIGEKPYKSIIESEYEKGKRQSTSINSKAKDLDIRIFPGANIYGGPLIGSHVGSDVAADLIATEMANKEEISMLIDVGTNTEVVLGNNTKLFAASCPAGPAFEGGEIKYGMPAYNGAIEKIEFKNNKLEFETIGNDKPIGICGSGLIDILAQLKMTSRMNHLGVLENKKNEFVIDSINNITISRKDISSLAQAKAANYCGQKIVLSKYGIPVEKISNVYIAGGFGNYININNAIEIGFILNIDQNKIHLVGNTSIEGATKMLLSSKTRYESEEICKNIEHIELETTEDFFDLFVDGCQFSPMKN